FNAVGPQPFGHVIDLERGSWREQVRRIQPDVVYALLNWQALPFVHRVFTENPGIPFVWHFKEGPFICYEKGLWPELVQLTTRSDGQIYCSEEMRDWFETAMPGSTRHEDVLVLDGDLPKRDWFDVAPSPHAADDEIHTVVPGRPIGLHPPHVAALAAQKIHLHFYGEYTHELWREWIGRTDRVARGYLHLHPSVDQDRWVHEFSRYDAGWLHIFRSDNGGDLRRANWDDLNVPARISVLAAAGLPMLQLDNGTSRVAAQSIVRRLNMGLFFTELDELGPLLRDGARMKAIRESAWRQREEFTFDRHAERLVAFFRQVIEHRSGSRRRTSG
ncbi:MAG: glycosyltransferase family 2 protein, partial [Chloroflexota bacterium]|nr:glycosyltransferase family 2 protein [Chloroflexota bacterium]